jgi:hypothetical protein
MARWFTAPACGVPTRICIRLRSNFETGGVVAVFPIGVNLSKVHRIGALPVRFAIPGQYMPVNPDAFGRKWNIQIVISPVIPKSRSR